MFAIRINLYAQSYKINEAPNILHKYIPVKYTLGGHNCSHFEVQEETLIQVLQTLGVFFEIRPNSIYLY